MKRLFVHIGIFFSIAAGAFAQRGLPALNLLPFPKYIKLHSGSHHIKNNQIADNELNIQLVKHITDLQSHNPEAYQLNITPDSIIIKALSRTGVYWAQQTLNQLITTEGKNKHYIPCCTITDYPSFPIRGFMHDVGRSYIPVQELKKQIKLLSQFKINVFHWHLTEDLAWRLQSRVYPQLTDSDNFQRFPGKFYTIQDAREIAGWCEQHQMQLIPEIDMPGHSEAFSRAMKCDMQSQQGIIILKEVMSEICNEIFPNSKYIHIGTDEVHFTNPDFVAEMVAHIRAQGKKVISWNPGWKYKTGEVDALQLWSYRGKLHPGIPAIDSKFHYINHFDVFGDIIALYNSRIGNEAQATENMRGGIIALWNDRKLTDENQIIQQNSFYPTMLAFAERAWTGGGTEYFDKKGVILPTDIKDSVFKSFADFERRMIWHKENTFLKESFPYVKQTNVNWLITDPFPNYGQLSAVFPPEKELKKEYVFNGETFRTKPAKGAAVYLRHVWGNLIPGFYKNPQENHTAYAYTWVYSPRVQEAGLLVEFQNYSRSESDLPPPRGKWDFKNSKIWLNNQEILPPCWINTHIQRTNEIPLQNENFTARPPIKVLLRKGWNKVLLKLPVGNFTTPEIRLVKWGFTCVFVTLDGKNELSELIYNPTKFSQPSIDNK